MKAPLLLFIITLVFGCTPDDPGWHDGNRVSAEWKYNSIGDTRVESELVSHDQARIVIQSTVRGKRNSGTILFDSGVFLVKDLDLEKGHEAHYLLIAGEIKNDVIALLQTAFPDGPSSISQNTRANVPLKRPKVFLMPAPSKFDVSAERRNDGSIQFKFTLKYGTDAEKYGIPAEMAKTSVPVSGAWQYSHDIMRFDDSLSIQEWKAYELGPVIRREEGKPIYQLAPKPILGYRTLGKLRKAREGVNQSEDKDKSSKQE